MARHEADREDLWAEAVALVSRVELRTPDDPQPLLVGYRANGWCSVYIGQDLMLQFTPAGGLRRAFRDGTLYRTQGSALARMTRHRTDTEATLLRHDLSAEELAEFRQSVHETIRRLLDQIASGTAIVQRLTGPDPASLIDRIQTTLTTILHADEFLAPAIVKGR